jgi:hypothetical protein
MKRKYLDVLCVRQYIVYMVTVHKSHGENTMDNAHLQTFASRDAYLAALAVATAPFVGGCRAAWDIEDCGDYCTVTLRLYTNNDACDAVLDERFAVLPDALSAMCADAASTAVDRLAMGEDLSEVLGSFACAITH